MSHLILPGNYVTHLNSWTQQGLAVFPGFAVYREVGFAKVPKGLANAAASLPLMVGSPNLSAVKPRLDRRLTVPAGTAVLSCSMAVFNVGAFNSSSVGTLPQRVRNPQANTAQQVGDGQTGILKASGLGSYLKVANALASTDANGRFANGIVFSSTALGFGDATAPTDGLELAIFGATAPVNGTRNLWRTVDPDTKFEERTVVFPFDAAAPLVVQTADLPMSVYSAAALAGVTAGAAIYSAEGSPYDVYILGEVVFAKPDSGLSLDDVHLPFAIEAGQA